MQSYYNPNGFTLVYEHGCSMGLSALPPALLMHRQLRFVPQPVAPFPARHVAFALGSYEFLSDRVSISLVQTPHVQSVKLSKPRADQLVSRLPGQAVPLAQSRWRGERREGVPVL